MAGALKILMTTDTVGGVWTYTIDLCKALEAYNVEVYLTSMGALVNKQQQLQLDTLQNVSFYESNYKLEWMQDAQYDVEKAKEWITGIYGNIKPDILHFNNFGQTAGYWSCPVVTVYHSCVQTWWKAVKGERPPKEWDWYIALLKDALNASDAIIFPSNSMQQQAEAVFRSLKGDVIYNGRSLKQPPDLIKEDVILTAGRIWDEGKNIQLLCSIAPSLPWPVHVAGNNVDPNNQEIPKLENVAFLGQLNQAEMFDAMLRASIFIMPAKYEPFGLAVLEAANASCALVLADIPTLKEIWGDAALYFDPVDKHAAAQAIVKLIKDAELRKEMALKAQQRAKAYTAKKMAEEYYQLYQSLI